ncbi:hypothetical protein [Cytobacillus oceanisediminis]|uniref:hypothetical protein n=1 Tax=Cytobacillus oceanisediminis TaxID=665099 RepID=UPI003736A96A
MLDFRNISTGQTKKETELKKENADLAYNLMLTEGEAQTARQEIADLNFQLMLNGVI